MPVNLIQRQINLGVRIKEGVDKGQLTREEAVGLGKTLRTEHQQIVADRMDPPGLTAGERVRAQRDLLQLSGRVRDLRRN
ncbi:MAG: hypothetical protein VKO21_01680 [Candidatus Sericytochromatia bacterium]|nr:hypothetical protein [Candidatus Sericytochromatia bacterium]